MRSEPATERAGYAAFLSHSHDDKDRVKWLAGLLEGYWVPGKRRRRVFLDRKSVVAGSLDDGIKRALDRSEFLILCVSGSVPCSRWVRKEVRHFLEKDGRSPDRVLICRIGRSAEEDPKGNAKASKWIAELEKTLAREPGDHLIPDLRGTPGDTADSALSLLAPILGMADKDSLLDRRARFIARASRASVGLVVALLLAWVGIHSWLRTPEGAMWNHRRTLVAKAPGLKFDHADRVGPAVLALARADNPKAAKGLAAMVKGRPFHATMMLAVEAGVPSPNPDRVNEMVEESGNDVGAGFPLAGLLAARVVGSEEAKARAWAALEGRGGERNWMQSLAASGWWEESLQAWEDWKVARPDDVSEHYPMWLELHLLAGMPIDQGQSETNQSAWLEILRSEGSLFRIEGVLTNAALRGRLGEAAWEPLLVHLVAHASGKLDSGIDPGGGAQTIAAMAALAGRREEAQRLLGQTAYLESAPLDNWHAEPLAFRALAEWAVGNKSKADSLFESAIEAANAHIEASRTWGEHFAVARALVLAGKWREAAKLPPMLGAEMSRRTLELDLIEWWHLDGAKRVWWRQGPAWFRAL
jgi:hypothetical protein